MLADDLRPLSGLSNLRRLRFIGKDDAASEDVVLNLEDLAGLKRLEELRITFSGAVRSVCPVATMPALREIRLRGTRIADDDEGAAGKPRRGDHDCRPELMALPE